jgi:hypothetical protein
MRSGQYNRPNATRPDPATQAVLSDMDFDPQALSAVDDPYPVFRELRDHHPVFYSEERDL